MKNSKAELIKIELFHSLSHNKKSKYVTCNFKHGCYEEVERLSITEKHQRSKTYILIISFNSIKI